MSSRPEIIKKAKAKAARYCAMGERSPRQVRQKLEIQGLFPNEIETVIGQLTEEGFLDIERFCRAFANDKLRFNKWGRNRIRMELKAHFLANDDIEKALDGLDETSYQQILSELVEKKWKSLLKEENPLIRKKKTIEYGIRKGFEPDMVFATLNTIMSGTRQS